jgi:hypothetical protein
VSSFSRSIDSSSLHQSSIIQNELKKHAELSQTFFWLRLYSNYNIIWSNIHRFMSCKKIFKKIREKLNKWIEFWIRIYVALHICCLIFFFKITQSNQQTYVRARKISIHSNVNLDFIYFYHHPHLSVHFWISVLFVLISWFITQQNCACQIYACIEMMREKEVKDQSHELRF